MAPNSSSSRRDTLLNLLIPLFSIIIVVAIGLIIHYDQLSSFPPEGHFNNLDAGWYKSIREHGYKYDSTAANNTAFFPLFPYIWRLLHLGSIGIGIFNGVLFILSTFILMQQFRAGWRTRMLYCALSLLVFYITPYAESLFFFFAVLMLVGLKKENKVQVISGILGAGLSRSVAILFAPAFLLVGLYKWYHTKRLDEAKPYFGYSAVSLISMLVVFTIQWYQTGEFFAFTITQQYWNNKWQSFGIPLSSWGSEENKLYDQLALFVCLLCIIASIAALIRPFRKQVVSIEAFSLFSRFYYSGLMLLMLFTKGGELNSINRYVFASPFLFILLKDCEELKLKGRQIFAVALLGIAYFLVCWHMGISLARMLHASILLAVTLLIPWMLRKKDWLAIIPFLLIIVGCLAIQGLLWYRYTINEWVG